jgi:hypothetical protein
MPMIGSMARTPIPSFQLIERSRKLAPIIRKTDEIRDEIACDTNILTASTSDVRFVRSFAGVICWI